VTAVGEALRRCRAEGRAALVGYLPACFPDVERGIANLQALLDGGVDILEIGLPYSDPVLDGPVIARAADVALRAGSTTAAVLRTLEAVAASGAAAVIMTYWNPVERYGVDRFAAAVAAAGGSGLVTPDLLPDEAEAWLAASDAHGLDRIFLVAPSSTDERIALTVRFCRGFVYAASVMGVTGVRERASVQAPELVARVRRYTSLPVGVGLGVGTAEQAAEVAQYADAVIVGSAFVRCVFDAGHDAPAALRKLAADLAAGVRRMPATG